MALLFIVAGSVLTLLILRARASAFLASNSRGGWMSEQWLAEHQASASHG